MQRNFLQALFHQAERMSMAPPHSSFLTCCRSLRRYPVLPHTRYQTVAVRASQKQWVHVAATRCAAEEKKPSADPVAQQEDPLSRAPSPGQAPQPGSSTEAGAPKAAAAQPSAPETDPLQDKSISVFQRYKKTFKQYGKVLIPVHLVTSTFWFGSFYYAAMKGINVVPFLEFIGLPECVVNILKNSQSGNALTAYAMYKIATPARYTVTLGGTSLSVKYLRRYGYMSTPPLMKNYIQDTLEETKERLSEKMEETREKISEKMEETKDLITEKIQETQEKFSFRKKKDE
ncbi:protein FAM210A isoform X2 [Rhinatrema bivittatum]|nr:protein FAM210A isoform X2 [Rhinatrema bivittatum]XP_029446787.1 protein FAM210A isoform X2 [Rhinatrema bivittatum]XP_029446788.1 protein FAM210A isoform X2 [Rhinatrema bivittatum]XP_029446789.1 protein FAM210A isoform X2 [Rhinatrema bivittatum]